MNTRILLVTHAPLAQALRACALHVFADSAADVLALDLPPDEPPEFSLERARTLLEEVDGTGQAPVLVLTDMLGATPCNVARRLVAGRNAHLVAGVNLPMLLRAVTYRHEALPALVERAIAGGTLGVLAVGAAPLQN